MKAARAGLDKALSLDCLNGVHVLLRLFVEHTDAVGLRKAERKRDGFATNELEG